MAFDRPVTHVAFGQNPWPYAKQLMEQGVEVQEYDFAPEGHLYLVDLAAMDEMLSLFSPPQPTR